MKTRKTDLTVFIELIVRRNLTKNCIGSDVLEHKGSDSVALERRSGRRNNEAGESILDSIRINDSE
jgi:hypothetical protein